MENKYKIITMAQPHKTIKLNIEEWKGEKMQQNIYWQEI